MLSVRMLCRQGPGPGLGCAVTPSAHVSWLGQDGGRRPRRAGWVRASWLPGAALGVWCSADSASLRFLLDHRSGTRGNKWAV